MSTIRPTASPRDIVIFGAGGYARCVADAAECVDRHRIVAFVDDGQASGAKLLGKPVVLEEEYFSSGRYPACGVVGIGDCSAREAVVRKIADRGVGFQFVSIVHPNASLSRYAEIGTGAVVLAGSIVSTGAQLGDHVSLYTNVVVEHDDSIAEFVSMAPAACLGGGVKVGARTFIGLGAVVKHGIEIGSDVVIGAGAAVLHNLPDSVVAAGNPARTIRARSRDEPYL